MVAHPDPARESALHKPRLRGALHAFMTPVSVVAGATLVWAADSWSDAVFAAVFGFSVFAMFIVSAILHRHWWSDRAWDEMRRLDHTTIYLLIGGTYTGLLGPGLGGTVRTVLLAVAWGATLGGIAFRWTSFKPPKGFMNSLFISFGWIAVIAVPYLWRDIGPTRTSAVLAGGILYTIGAIILGAQWPDPRPRTFGYHEVWHILVVAGLALHYAVVASLVTR